jgi:hypothetical protein
VCAGLIDIHPTWIGLPPGLETSNSWRWFHLSLWADAATYEAVLTHFADPAALTTQGVLDLIALSTEALTRSGAAIKRCTSNDVEWARRIGLALFGAAVSRTWLEHGAADTSASGAVVRCLLPGLSDGERAIAMLASPCEGGIGEHWLLLPPALDSKPIPDHKIRRLVDLCRQRVTLGVQEEASR